MRQPVQVPNPTGRPLTSSKGVFGGRLPGLGGGEAPTKNIFGDPQASYKKVLLNKLRGAKGQQPVTIFDRLNYGRVATGRAAAAGQKRIAGNWLLKLAGNKPQEPLKPGKLDEALARPGPAGPLPIGKLEEAMARGGNPVPPTRNLSMEEVAAQARAEAHTAKPVQLADSGGMAAKSGKPKPALNPQPARSKAAACQRSSPSTPRTWACCQR